MEPAAATAQRRRWKLPQHLFPRARLRDEEDKPAPSPSRLRAAARGLGLSILHRQRRLKQLASAPGAWKGPAAFLAGCAFVLLVGWLRWQKRDPTPTATVFAASVRGSRRFDPQALWQPKQRSYLVNASYLGGPDIVPPFPVLPPAYLDTSDAASVQAAAGPAALASLTGLEGCPLVGAWGEVLRSALRFWPPGVIPSLSVRGDYAAGAAGWDGSGPYVWVAQLINGYTLVTPPPGWWNSTEAQSKGAAASRRHAARRVAALIAGLQAASEGRDFEARARDGRAGTRQTALPDAEFQFHVEPRPLLGPLQRRSAPSRLVAPVAGPGAAPAFLDVAVPGPGMVWWEGAAASASAGAPYPDVLPLTEEEGAAEESLGMATDELLQLMIAAAEESPVEDRRWQALFRGDIGAGTSSPHPARLALLETVRSSPSLVAQAFDVRDTRSPSLPRWGGPPMPLLNYTQWAAHIYLAADPVVPLELLLATGAPVFVVSPPVPPSAAGPPPPPLPYYFPLLRPHEDYVPVASPRHLLAAVRHLLQISPALPAGIGAHGLAFVKNTLSPRGRACFWRQFIQEMSARNAHPIMASKEALRLPRLRDTPFDEAVELLAGILLTPPGRY